MLRFLDDLARKALQRIDAETAHAVALRALTLAALARSREDDPRLAVQAFGLRFPNPVGIAAGLDKNADVPDALLRVGAGFTEIGTITPRPQLGNPRPRVFRLPADAGIINRLGFNSEGHEAVGRKLARRTGTGVVGVNVGANRDAADRVADYVAGIRAFAPYASYFTVNVSSPNTPGLRDLQSAPALDALLARVLEARAELPQARRRPVLLKIAPDLSLGDLDDIVAVARRRGIDGMIVSNTTVARPAGLRDGKVAAESGGLSGRPLFPLATRMLAETFLRIEGAFPLIGVGGVDSGEAALAKIRAGATLIQLYTGLVHRGLSLIDDIKLHLLAAMQQAHTDSLAPFVGVNAAALCREPWPG